MKGARRNDDQARPTVWLCARCEREYRWRGNRHDDGPRPRLRVSACPVCVAILKTTRRASPGAIAPELAATMERIGQMVVARNARQPASGPTRLQDRTKEEGGPL